MAKRKRKTKPKPKTRVALHFEGVIYVDVDADPDDAEAWVEAIGKAWADVPDDEIGEAADLTSEEIDA